MAHVSNDKRPSGKSLRSIRPCPDLGGVVRELWVRVLGARGVWSYDSPWCGSGWGGSTSGPPNPSLEGRLDPLGLSPEAIGWATPDYAAALRDSG